MISVSGFILFFCVKHVCIWSACVCVCAHAARIILCGIYHYSPIPWIPCARHDFAHELVMQHTRTHTLCMCWWHCSWITQSTHKKTSHSRRRTHTHIHTSTNVCRVRCLEAAQLAVELQMGCSHQSSQQDVWLSRCFHHGQVGAAASPCYPGQETPEERRCARDAPMRLSPRRY